MQTLCLFALHPNGFRHRDVRSAVAELLGRPLDDYGPGQMTYDLRRLRLHGLIERVPRSHGYRITESGARLAVLYLRIYARGFRPAASLPTAGTRRGMQALERLNLALTNFLEEVRRSRRTSGNVPASHDIALKIVATHDVDGQPRAMCASTSHCV